jgi:anti-sigma B factor antagonist
LILRYPDPADAKPGVPVLVVEVLGDSQAVTIEVCGEVDIATAELLAEGLRHGLRKRPARLSVILSRVSFFSAAGLHTLLAARNEANACAVRLVLLAPSSHVLTVLKLARVKELFDIESEPPPEPADIG